jgi:V8-like Glu-specific endopeptidase
LHGAQAVIKGDYIPVHPKYLQNHGNYDFGIVHLDQDIGTKMGFASLNVASDLDLNNRIVNITGYPGSMGALRHLLGKEALEMYSASGPIVYFDEDMFRYHIDTSGGQSGAGVWGLDSENFVECYGIHVLGSKVQGNGAIRINSGNFETIKNWLEEFNDI